MTKNTTRSDIAKYLNEQLGFSISQSAELVDRIIDAMQQGIVEGGELKISGFGTFSLREKVERIGRNPKTKEPHVIPKRRVVSFKASRKLKNTINS